MKLLISVFQRMLNWTERLRRAMKINLRPGAKKNGSKSPTSSTRKALSSKGAAMPDGSFPTPNADFLRRAVQSIGRVDPAKRAKVVAYLKRRAKALGVNAKPGSLLASQEHSLLVDLTACLDEMAVELAGAMPTYSETSSSSDGPRVVSAGKKLGLKTPRGTKVYAKARKKGMTHAMALKAAKFADAQADEMSNSPKA
jgi:hypothetical protein